MTNAIYKEARALNQEKWTIHFDEYTSVNLSRYKIPQSVYSELTHHMRLNCESALESWKLSQSIATSNRTQRTETVIPIRTCFVASRTALQYDTRLECAYVHTRVCYPKCTSWNLSPKFTEPDTSVTRASVCLNSFSNAEDRVSTTPILRAARIVCTLFILFRSSVLRLSRAPFSKINENERAALRERSPSGSFIFFSELIKGRDLRESYKVGSYYLCMR